MELTSYHMTTQWLEPCNPPVRNTIERLSASWLTLFRADDASNDGKIAGDPLKTLFVSRLNHNTDEETLRGVFSKLGPVSHVRVVRDIVTGFSRGYGFVTFEHDSDFRRAWREAHRMYVDGVTILVEYERERVAKGWVPRRFGGGIGGKKESGQLRFGGRDRPFRRPLDVPATSMEDFASVFFFFFFLFGFCLLTLLLF